MTVSPLIDQQRLNGIQSTATKRPFDRSPADKTDSDPRLNANTRPERSFANVDPDLEIIDNFGVTAVAKALDISREAVRLWRTKGTIPDNRRDELRQLAERDLGQVGQPPPSSPSTSLGQGPINPFDAANPKRIAAGPAIKDQAEVAIAQRLAELAGESADQARQTLPSDGKDEPARWYALRLAFLFALDFPVLTMAFESVVRTSPIVAAGSAVALSLFLVIGAHLLGGVLRQAAAYLANWCRHAVVLLALSGFLAGIVVITWDLRMKGLDLEVTDTTEIHGLVFASSDNEAIIMPEAFRATIGYASALVTVGSLLFGTAWSYRQHGPMAAWLKAEAIYRRRVRELAKAKARLSRKRNAPGIGLLAATMMVGMPDHANAADCDAGTVLAFIDTTTSFDDVDRQAIMPAIEAMAASLQPDQRLVIRTIRSSVIASRRLFDACVPPVAEIDWSVAGLLNWLTTDKSTLVVKRRSFFAGIQAAAMPELAGAGGADQSAIMDTLIHHIGKAAPIASIWMFSDLLESVTLSSDELLNDHSDMPTTYTHSLHSLLAGAPVYVAGIGRWHDRGRRALDAQEKANLIDVWTAFIAAIGGDLRVAQSQKNQKNSGRRE